MAYTLQEIEENKKYVDGAVANRWAIFKACDYTPSKEQEAIHFWDLQARVQGIKSRIKQITGGIRSGKTLSASLEVISRCHEGKLYWLAAEDFEMARGEFEYCMEYAKKLGILNKFSFPKEGRCEMTVHGGIIIRTWSLKDPIKIARESPDGIVICEAAQTSWENVQGCMQRVVESRGWLYLEGTMEASNTYYADQHKEWSVPNNVAAKSFSLPTWSNLAVFPGGRQDPEILFQESRYPADVFLERFGGEPCPLSQLIIKEFRNETHVGEYPFQPELPVEICVDPGGAFKSGAYAVLAVQQWDDIFHIVDEIYMRGYVTEEIVDIATVRPWWGNVKGGSIDIAGHQHHSSASKESRSDVDIWYQKTGMYLQSSRVIESTKGKEAGGIDRLRTYMSVNPITHKPKVLVHHTAKGFISECGGGRSPVEGGGAWLRDSNTGKPLDKNNHAVKAFYYWLVNKVGYVKIDTGGTQVISTLHGRGYAQRPKTFGELSKTREEAT